MPDPNHDESAVMAANEDWHLNPDNDPRWDTRRDPAEDDSPFADLDYDAERD